MSRCILFPHKSIASVDGLGRRNQLLLIKIGFLKSLDRVQYIYKLPLVAEGEDKKSKIGRAELTLSLNFS